MILEEATAFIGKTYAKSTQQAYRTHLRQYLRFCIFFNLTPVPASQTTLIAYITYLARTLKPSSIGNYINIIRLLHLDAGMTNPLENNFQVLNLRKGIARHLGSPPQQKLPITSEIMLGIYHKLCMYIPDDVAFWAACIVGFLGFLRKSTLLPVSGTNPGDSCVLIYDLDTSNDSCYILSIRKSKTIQFGQRVLTLPFAQQQDSPLCPVEALRNLLYVAPFNHKLPLFSYRKGGRVFSWTHSKFITKLRSLLQELGYDPYLYSGHSFRRGGASLGFALGLSILDIKNRGDWRSAAVEKYIFIEEAHSIQVAKALVRGASLFHDTK